MGGIVTASFTIGESTLTRADLDKIVKIMKITDTKKLDGSLVQPPVGANCLYSLVLTRTGQDLDKLGDTKPAP